MTDIPPLVFEKHISRSVVNIPPAEISWPERIIPLRISSWIVLKTSLKYAGSVTVGASSPSTVQNLCKAAASWFKTHHGSCQYKEDLYKDHSLLQVLQFFLYCQFQQQLKL